jgi:hypothetical protein
MGLAAPRVSHARVYVNGEYLGLFGVIEPIDKRFLRRTLGEDSGYLYEFEWAGDYRFEWLGDDPARYAGMFEAETRESEPIERRYATLLQMIATTTRGATNTWVQTMSRYVDFERLFAYLAVESFLADHDGLAGDWGINNFYLYRYANRDRFEFLPWDKDVTFREIDRDVFEGVDTHHLFSAALQFPDLRQQYLEALQRVAAIAATPQESGAGWLEHEVQRHAATIRAAAHADPSKPFTNQRFEQEVAWMVQFARYRASRVADFAR